MAGVSKKDIVYELGSGDGEFILTAAEEFHAKKAIGIEIDYTRYWISKIRKQTTKNNNAFFIRSDFKKVKLTDATVVYFYLVPAVIKRIMPKLRKELRPGTKIVSYRYEVPLKLLKKSNGLFLYKI
jgi:tRNA G46 methylase TrmB